MGRRRETTSRRPRLLPFAGIAGTVALALLLSTCVGGGEPEPTPSASPTPSSTPVPRASAAPSPGASACYRLTYAQALRSTSTAKPVPCTGSFTVRTFHVGEADVVADGHLLAIDSERVQRQTARECPRRFAAYVGGSAEQRRLSMLSPVWFGPTLTQADHGQAWFRCDVIALAAPKKLATLQGTLQNVLGSEAGRDHWGRCATAKPGSAGAVQVLCADRHAWRAVATLDITPGKNGAYPGTAQAKAAGAACEDRVRDLADDPLTFTWGYLPPTRQQWAAGQHHGFCWAPD